MKKTLLGLSAFTLCAMAISVYTDVLAKDNQEQQKKLPISSYVTQIRADEVWKEKDTKGQFIKGKGIKIAIIDSGFDAKHPDFVGVKWNGYDYVHNKKTLIDTMGHGTHVAGICKRVAPEASFSFYRVFENNVGANFLFSANVCRAMEQAMKDGADVINLSLLDLPGKKVDIYDRVIRKATKKGIVVVVCAGNNGPSEGTMYSILADSTSVITVGACTKKIPIPTLQIREYRKILETIPATKVSPPFPMKGSYRILDLGKSTNLKQAKGKIILVKRSEKLNTEFLRAAKRAGVIGVVGVNNAPGEWYGEQNIGIEKGVLEKLVPKLAPFVTVSGSAGEYLKQQIAKGRKQVEIGTVNKERMVCSSSSGPSVFTLKHPDLVAPGQDIYSSFPVKLDKTGHKSCSGTSMATPVVSGSIALLKQMHPNWTPEQIKAALANNAVALMTSENIRSPYLLQGSGRIDVSKAIHTKTFLTPNQLCFGELKLPETKKNHQIGRILYLQNTSKEAKTYRIQSELVTGNSYLKMQIPPTVTVKANSKKGIPLFLKVLPNIPKGVYIGSVTVRCGKEKWKVPYSFFVEWSNPLSLRK